MKSKNGLVIVLGIVCVFLLCIVGYTVMQSKKELKEVPETSEDLNEVSTQDGVTVDGIEYELNSNIEAILFMGIDKEARTDFHNSPGLNGQSDSMNLLILNKETKKAQMMQISRDTMVEIDIYSIMDDKLMTEPGQICLQYAYGDGEKRSCILARDKVSELLYGVEIDAYLSLTLEGMTKAAQQIGGVEVIVPEDYTYIDPAFSKGATVVLDEHLTEKYVRSRDFEALEANEERMERQAQYMKALMNKLQSIDNLEQYMYLYQELEPYMVTNLTAEEMMELAEYEVSTEMITIPGEIQEIDGYAGLVVDNEKLQKIVLDLFYKPL